jgi:hypothetical protein
MGLRLSLNLALTVGLRKLCQKNQQGKAISEQRKVLKTEVVAQFELAIHYSSLTFREEQERCQALERHDFPFTSWPEHSSLGDRLSLASRLTKSVRRSIESNIADMNICSRGIGRLGICGQ